MKIGAQTATFYCIRVRNIDEISCNLGSVKHTLREPISSYQLTNNFGAKLVQVDEQCPHGLQALRALGQRGGGGLEVLDHLHEVLDLLLCKDATCVRWRQEKNIAVICQTRLKWTINFE